MKIVYVGTKPQKADNVAETKLIWTPGQIHEVADDLKAAKLLTYQDIWADADKPYKVRDPSEAPKPLPPAVTVTVPGARFVIGKTDEEIREIAAERLIPVFMTKADAEAFELWKLDRDTAPESKTLGLPKKNRDARAVA